MPQSSMNNFAKFIMLLAGLKDVSRKPPVGVKADRFESTAEHCFLAAWLAWFFAAKRSGLDVQRIIKMALVHDLAKIPFGGKTPPLFAGGRKRTSDLVLRWPKLSQAERNALMLEQTRQEQKKVEKILSLLDPKLRDEILVLWQEAEWGKSPEARFGWQVAVLENLVQAFIYYRRGYVFNLQPWLAHAKKFVDEPLLLDFLDALERMIEREISVRKSRRGRKR